MRSFPLVSALAAVAVWAHALTLPAQDLRGTWRGYWARAGDTLPVTLAIGRDAASGAYQATFASERLRVSGIPFAAVRVAPCCTVSMTLRGDRTTTSFDGRVDGDSLFGRLTEEQSSGTFLYRRVVDEPPAYEARDLTFRNGDVGLAGTLLLPRGAPARAGVVFLHGSGAEGRWASRFMAEQLVPHGVAALIYDKRGVGASSGDWRQASLDDLAGDAAAAIAALSAVPALVGRPVGVYGHSQGGTIAPMVALRAPGVAFVIASAAAGIPTDSVEEFSVGNSVLPRARTRDDSAHATAFVAALVDAAYRGASHAPLDTIVARFRGAPWLFAPPPADDAYWRLSPIFHAYHPAEWWSRVRVPVLLLHGEADQRVPARESAARIAALLLRGGDGDVTVRLFAGADHTFRLPPGPSGWPRTPSDFVPTIVDWLARHP